jgi:hypothetical protein
MAHGQLDATAPEADAASTTTRRWGWAHYLALAGVPFFVWQSWALISWLAAGPHGITTYNDNSSPTWYAARVFEAIAIAIAVTVGWWVIRGCIRAGEVTLEALFCLAAGTTWIGDAGFNFYQPLWLTSSNWTNTNQICGNIPFVVNPDCGAVPDPTLFFVLFMTFAVLGAAEVMRRVIDRVQARWPRLSRAQLFLMLVAGGAILDLAFEIPAVALQLWTYSAPLAVSIPLGQRGALRYPIPELIAVAVWMAIAFSVYIFRDSEGRTVLERGLDHLGRLRKVVVFMAVFGMFQIITWTIGIMPVAVLGPYINEWPRLPAHLMNQVCDTDGVGGTTYGPCPGTPGYRMPIR